MADYKVDPDRARAATAQLHADFETARKSRMHLWLAVASFRVSDLTVEHLADQVTLLDSENLVTVMLGCYVCEQSYTPQLRHRRCPGEPTDG